MIYWNIRKRMSRHNFYQPSRLKEKNIDILDESIWISLFVFLYVQIIKKKIYRLILVQSHVLINRLLQRIIIANKNRTASKQGFNTLLLGYFGWSKHRSRFCIWWKEENNIEILNESGQNEFDWERVKIKLKLREKRYKRWNN